MRVVDGYWQDLEVGRHLCYVSISDANVELKITIDFLVTISGLNVEHRIIINRPLAQ